MTSSELRQQLASLHQQLGAAPKVDQESRQLLRALLVDIEQLLDQPVADAAAVAGVARTHRLEELTTRFEADHPALAGVLRQVADALGKAGL